MGFHQLYETRLSIYKILFSTTSKKKLKNLNEVDPELLKAFNKLGISISEQKN